MAQRKLSPEQITAAEARLKVTEAYLNQIALEARQALKEVVELESDGGLPLLREVEHTRQWVKAEFGGQVVALRLSGGVARLLAGAKGEP